MPWTARDARKHTKKANTARRARLWAHVANSALKRGASEASAIRQANAAVNKDILRQRAKRRRKKRRKS